MKYPQGFQWTNTPDPEWVRALEPFGPVMERRAHLLFVWESGTPVEPIQRWEIYEATPLAYVPEWKIGAFHADPPCRCATPWTPEPRCPRCQGLNSPGRYRILDYLRQTECLALPFWVIQGTQGGHKHRFNQVEQQWQRMMGRKEDPPDPGSLPYAPFDNRVTRKLRQYNRAWRAYANLATAYGEEVKDAQLAFRKALSDYVDNSVGAEFDALTLRQRAGLKDEVRTDFTQTSAPFDMEWAQEDFLRGGQ